MYKKVVNFGYFRRTVSYDKNLKYCPYGSCGVNVYSDGRIDLISYTTRVITITPDRYIYCTGTYSNTTAKHINAFLKEYAPSFTYYDMKKSAREKIAFNLDTREVIGLQ
jgi:hypothetical protein